MIKAILKIVHVFDSMENIIHSLTYTANQNVSTFPFEFAKQVPLPINSKIK